MSDLSIRTSIKTVLEAVSSVGNVYDYHRWTVTDKDFLDVFGFTDSTGKKKILNWMIVLGSVRMRKVGMDGGWQILRNYRLIGIYGLKDSLGTEKLLSAVIDLILIALANSSIPDAQTPQDLPTVKTIEHRKYGAYLCHYAEITFTVAEDLAATVADMDDLTQINVDYNLLDPEVVDTILEDEIDTT